VGDILSVEDWAVGVVEVGALLEEEKTSMKIALIWERGRASSDSS